MGQCKRTPFMPLLRPLLFERRKPSSGPDRTTAPPRLDRSLPTRCRRSRPFAVRRYQRAVADGARREPPMQVAKGCPGAVRRAPEAPRSAGFMARERSEPRQHFWRILFERSERSERSELCAGPWTRAPQGSRSEAEAASSARRAAPGQPFATTELRLPIDSSCVRNWPGLPFQGRRRKRPADRPRVERLVFQALTSPPRWSPASRSVERATACMW